MATFDELKRIRDRLKAIEDREADRDALAVETAKNVARNSGRLRRALRLLRLLCTPSPPAPKPETPERTRTPS